MKTRHDNLHVERPHSSLAGLDGVSERIKTMRDDPYQDLIDDYMANHSHDHDAENEEMREAYDMRDYQDRHYP